MPLGLYRWHWFLSFLDILENKEHVASKLVCSISPGLTFTPSGGDALRAFLIVGGSKVDFRPRGI